MSKLTPLSETYQLKVLVLCKCVCVCVEISKQSTQLQQSKVRSLGPQVVPLYAVCGEGSPTKIDYRPVFQPLEALEALRI